MSVNEAAAMLHKSRTTVFHWVNEGRLPSKRLSHHTKARVIVWRESVERLAQEMGYEL